MPNGNSGFEALYQRGSILGRGASGVAFLVRPVREPHLQYVAKEMCVVRSDEKRRRDAHQECQMLRELSHKNIVKCIDVYQDDEMMYIVMEYADGGDLSMRIQAQRAADKKFTEETVMAVFGQICNALHYLHSRKIVHRDLKPPNVFVVGEQELLTCTIKLGDFGIAKMIECTMGQAHSTVGTPSYLSPEICKNNPYGMKSDIWSLGIILYELACLKVPFQAGNLPAMALMICTSEPKPIPEEFGLELQELVTLLLQKDPGKRPPVSALLWMPLVQRALLPEDLQLLTAAGDFPSSPPPIASVTSTHAAPPPLSHSAPLSSHHMHLHALPEARSPAVESATARADTAAGGALRDVVRDCLPRTEVVAAVRNDARETARAQKDVAAEVMVARATSQGMPDVQVGGSSGSRNTGRPGVDDGPVPLQRGSSQPHARSRGGDTTSQRLPSCGPTSRRTQGHYSEEDPKQWCWRRPNDIIIEQRVTSISSSSMPSAAPDRGKKALPQKEPNQSRTRSDNRHTLRTERMERTMERCGPTERGGVLPNDRVDRSERHSEGHHRSWGRGPGGGGGYETKTEQHLVERATSTQSASTTLGNPLLWPPVAFGTGSGFGSGSLVGSDITMELANTPDHSGMFDTDEDTGMAPGYDDFIQRQAPPPADLLDPAPPFADPPSSSSVLSALYGGPLEPPRMRVRMRKRCGRPPLLAGEDNEVVKSPTRTRQWPAGLEAAGSSPGDQALAPSFHCGGVVTVPPPSSACARSVSPAQKVAAVASSFRNEERLRGEERLRAEERVGSELMTPVLRCSGSAPALPPLPPLIAGPTRGPARSRSVVALDGGGRSCNELVGSAVSRSETLQRAPLMFRSAPWPIGGDRSQGVDSSTASGGQGPPPPALAPPPAQPPPPPAPQRQVTREKDTSAPHLVSKLPTALSGPPESRDHERGARWRSDRELASREVSSHGATAEGWGDLADPRLGSGTARLQSVV